ncbi:hypothetical protein NEMBOFW57_007861 [Staphylotrichum longicolle]|uniref:Uncharacterized protein n=1 Tax=Staphylotrichum longicolle TaxID=669026 RepID=A0AAD4HZH7_9PEZI|nr:hypothetical protein NEMBOFW57_007861 [Staphylotrichum longicolle]
MGKHSIALAFLQLLSLGTAQEHQFYKWNTPRSILEAGRTKLGRMRRPGLEHLLDNKRADVLGRTKLLRDNNGPLNVRLLHIGFLDQRDGD